MAESEIEERGRDWSTKRGWRERGRERKLERESRERSGVAAAAAWRGERR